MSNLSIFQNSILHDADARKEFARNPAAYLNKLGVTIPAGTKVPASIPLPALEQTIGEINQKLAERGIDAKGLMQSDASSVSKFVHDATQPRIAQDSLDKMKQVVSEYNSRVASGNSPGDAATALAIGAVVVAVVVAPVAVALVSVEGEE